MNLFDNIIGGKGFLGTATPDTPFQPTQQPVAPRTSSYTQPAIKKMSYEMPGYKESTQTRFKDSPTEGLFYKGVQGVADIFTGAKESLKRTESNDKAIFEQEMNAKKQKFTQDKLKEGYTTKQIDGALKLLEDRGEFTYKPGFGARLATNLGSRMQEMENTTERLSNQVGTPNRTLAEGAVSYIGDVVGGIPGDVIGATIDPVVSPVIQKVVEKVGVENVKAVSDWYSKTKQENPAIIDALEGVFNIAGAVAPFTKTGQQVIKAPANLAKDVVVGATEIPGKTVNKVKSFFPTPEQKLVKNLGQETAPGIVDGKTVNVPVPEKGIIERFTGGLGREKDTKVLAGRALTPTYAGKTPKQILSTVGDVEKNVKILYEKVRTGEYTGDISTLENAANTVVTNLESIGGKIGEAVKETTGKIPLSKNRAVIKKVLSDPIEKRGGAYKVLKNFYQDTAPIDGLSIQRAFKAKKIYQAEIRKLIKSGDSGTDAYEALVKGVQELNDGIDNAIANTPGFKGLKSQYSHLKKLVSDIAKSAAVEGRRSPQTFVEQLGMVETLMDAVSNPLSTAGKLFTKEIGELNTRGGAWKELMKIYDTEAIASKGAKIKAPIKKPKKITPKDPTEIPEGYFKNVFGEIVKNPSNKKGGFIKIPGGKGPSMSKGDEALMSEARKIPKSKTAKELEGKVFYTGQKADWTPKKLREYNPSTDDSLMYGPGLYLTPDISIAQGYAREGGKVHSVMPEIKNPLTPSMKDWLTFIQKGNGKMKQDFLIRKGYDAVVDIKGKYKQIMIVDPTQVKKVK